MTPNEQGELPLSQAAESPLEHGVRGEVVALVYASEDGEYAVVRVVDSDDTEHVLIGAVADLQVGQHVAARGKRERHRAYGEQLRVADLRVVLPQTTEGMQRYLAGGVLPGVGPKMAERIVAQFGTDTFRVLDQFSGRLSEVPGLGKNKIHKIREAWHAQSGQRELLSHLQGIGLSKAYANRVIKVYGEAAPTRIAENPYRLAADVRGIGFRMADVVARHLDIEADNPFRLGAGVAHVLAEFAQQQGHTCVPISLLEERDAAMLEVGEDKVQLGIERAVADGAAVVSDDGGDEPLVFPARLHEAEQALVRMLGCFLPGPQLEGVGGAPRVESQSWQRLNEEQQDAVSAAFSHSLSIITGGPGVGKTTVTRTIVQAARELSLRISLCAPTGRAAKRLAESSGKDAQTIHRLLRWDPEIMGFSHNAENPLPADLLIVDEVSMLDLPLAVALFAAISPGIHVVLVGDRDQLPSVGPGSVLRDLIRCDRFAVTELKRVYRQGAGSLIVRNAHRVNEGKLPYTRPVEGPELLDYYWVEQEDPQQVVSLIGTMVRDRIPQRFGMVAERDIQVLSPMNRGDVGVSRINQHLQGLLNPHREGQIFVPFGETRFRLGDKVMQRSNNYDLHVFNGDIGHIIEVRPELKQLTVSYEGHAATYAWEEADQLQLAYATTIHKSQGSEFPAVVVPILMAHYVMLRRKLLYTAMTRARRLLILIGSPKALAQAVDNARVTPRFSLLADRLQRL